MYNLFIYGLFTLNWNRVLPKTGFSSFFRKPYENKFSTVFSKQKPPDGGGCFLLDRGAAGTKIELF